MLPCFFASNLFTLQLPRKPPQHSPTPPPFMLSLHLVVKPAFRKATSAQGWCRPREIQVPFIIQERDDVCAKTRFQRLNGYATEVGAERQNVCDSEGPNQREIAGSSEALVLSGNLSMRCSSLLCTLVCKECFLDKNRPRLGSNASGLPWHHSPSTSGTARVSVYVCVCVCEKGEAVAEQGGRWWHISTMKKKRKNWTQDGVMYRKESCNNVFTPTHSIGANE